MKKLSFLFAALVAGEVLVSRATADPYRLTVNYTLSSSAAGCC